MRTWLLPLMGNPAGNNNPPLVNLRMHPPTALIVHDSNGKSIAGKVQLEAFAKTTGLLIADY